MSTLDRPKWQLAEQRPVPEMPKIPDDVLSRAWQTDPYVSDPHSIIAVLTKFLAAVDSTMMIQFLPEEGVLNWVSNYAHRKTPEDFMLLYSILAVGVALSDGSEQIAHEYAQVAHYGQKMLETPCLQLVQSRILLAVYYVATCRHKEADQLISSAVATSSFLQLHLELDHSREASMKVFPFGMNRNGYAESRRRTFWALFMLERLSGYFPDRPVMINAEDIYTRLPADHASFERLVDIRAPMFDPYVSSFGQMAEQSIDIAGFQVELAHIWAETQAFNQRMALRPALADAEAQKLQSLTERAERWHAALPARLKFGGANLESAAFSGTIGSFLSIHMLYHHAMIKLNRHRGRLDQISVEARSEHAAKCRHHASSIIEMLDSLDRILRMRPTLLKTAPSIMAMAVTEAVDVLSASGSMTAMPDLIDILRVAKCALEKMTHVWRASSHSLFMVEQRMQNLELICKQGSRPSTPHDGYRLLPNTENKDRMGNRWQINDPIERSLPLEMDILYFKRGWEI
ncbi:putative transcriptional regulatory protein [Escovopsis weberi]|uniref:Putative transcriptional regulatory protein n=1 Tax=Escovopsis weberi TaxID=150374 RepID=A0A0M8MXL5_ESCWE|nr:putative transcriptional regulatory protein [Escovopsis weberi]